MTEEKKLYVRSIKHFAEALLGVVNDLLDYAKIEANKLNLYPEQFDLEGCIYEIIMILKPLDGKNSSISS
ncbi:MAG: hypothetical protein P8M25_17665 [Paracoccaceae bacterium]|nr:hypothetical protein [Paracoccaceae bacterium]